MLPGHLPVNSCLCGVQLSLTVAVKLGRVISTEVISPVLERLYHGIGSESPFESFADVKRTAPTGSLL